MASIQDLHRQIDQIDRQAVELLSRRMMLEKQVATQSKEDGPDPEREAQVLSNWLEEGIDYDLDEATLEKICKAVIDMSRKAQEI